MIEASHVDKFFHLQHQRTLKEMVQAFVKKQKTLEYVKALQDISFHIKKGESVGVIGKNGAGKSTLLKLIAGVSAPTQGNLRIRGSIAPLIELGAGFHPELTGGENIFMNGIILGLSEEQVKEIFPSIVAFSELQDFIDIPVKYYSSGMYMRLAFSVAIHVNADILLIDEILAVGDADFQAKCLAQMRKFREEGKTIVLVGHSEGQMKEFCDRVLYLQKGKLMFDGPVEEGYKHYNTV